MMNKLMVLILLVSVSLGSYHEDGMVFRPVMISIIGAEYDKALVLMDSLKEEYGEEPIYYLVKSSYYQTMMMDYEDYSNERIFISCLEKCGRLTEERYSENDAEYYYYRGVSKGYWAAHEGKKKRYWSAFRRGKQSISDLEKVIDMDSSFYDAYLAVGVYHYWMSEKLKNFSFIPGICDNRRPGKQKIKIAAKKATLSDYAARNMLAWVYIEEEELDSAYSITKELIERFPKSRTFYWTLLEIGKKKDDTCMKINALENLIRLMNEDSRKNPVNKLVCLEKLGRIYFLLGRNDEGLRIVNEALSITLDASEQDEVKDVYERLKKMEKKWSKS